MNLQKENGDTAFMMKAVLQTAKCFLIASMLSACTQNGQAPSSENLNTTTYGQLAVNLNRYSATKIVCDPLNHGATPPKTWKQGIRAELYHRTNSMPRWYTALEYILKGQKTDQNIFLTDMNVPTRLFTEGFSTTQGEVLKDDQNNKLIEYFGLKMNTNIVLSPTDEEGDYEFATLADDGAVLKIKALDPGAPDELLIQNDGDHPTKMGCSNKIIRMTKNGLLPVEMHYYQGPRYHISNVLMFRKSNIAGQDPQCGKSGNSMYFDYNNLSQPQKAFTDLLSRGWKVLTADNFRISVDTVDYNPCVVGTAPGITEFQVMEIIITDAILYWKTDIPATSQILVTEVASGQSFTTDSDNLMRLEHQVVLSGLQSDTLYRVQAISVSEDLGRSQSSPIEFRTP